jgi:hypothetical protein
MTYTFLELFRASNKKSLKLQNLGDTIGYFCKQFLVSIAKFAYTYTVNRITAHAVINKLEVATQHILIYINCKINPQMLVFDV